VKKTLVQEVMTTPVITGAGPMPFRALVALLYARDIGAVPVVTPAGVLGVVSNHDLIAKPAGPPAVAGPRLTHRSRRCKRRSLARTAGELMTTPAAPSFRGPPSRRRPASRAAGSRNGSPAQGHRYHPGA
jgi:CBS domain-containing protein